MKKINSWTLMLALVLLCMLETLALASDGTELPSAAARLINLLLEVLTPIAAMVGTVLAAYAAMWLHRKTGINLQQQMEDIVTRAVGFAEEKAHQALVTHGKKMRGPEKLEAAMDFALDLAERYKVPQWARDRLSKLIEAELGRWRPIKAPSEPSSDASSPPT